jgi:hypothetical protein
MPLMPTFSLSVMGIRWQHACLDYRTQYQYSTVSYMLTRLE